SAAIEPASRPTTDCSPSSKHCERPDYAEWKGTDVHAPADGTTTPVRHSRTIRHSSAVGINGGSQRARTRGLPPRRNRAPRHPSNQPAGRIAALELAASRDAERRPLRQRSSTAKCRSLALTLTT